MKNKKNLDHKIMKNSMYGKFGTGTVSIDIESKFDFEKSFGFLNSMVRCKTCGPLPMVGGMYIKRHITEKCPECDGSGLREMDWVEKAIHGRIDKDK